MTKVGVIQGHVHDLVVVQALSSGDYMVLDEDSILLFDDRTPAFYEHRLAA